MFLSPPTYRVSGYPADFLINSGMGSTFRAPQELPFSMTCHRAFDLLPRTTQEGAWWKPWACHMFFSEDCNVVGPSGSYLDSNMVGMMHAHTYTCSICSRYVISCIQNTNVITRSTHEHTFIDKHKYISPCIRIYEYHINILLNAAISRSLASSLLGRKSVLTTMAVGSQSSPNRDMGTWTELESHPPNTNPPKTMVWKWDGIDGV